MDDQAVIKIYFNPIKGWKKIFFRQTKITWYFDRRDRYGQESFIAYHLSLQIGLKFLHDFSKILQVRIKCFQVFYIFTTTHTYLSNPQPYIRLNDVFRNIKSEFNEITMIYCKVIGVYQLMFICILVKLYLMMQV